MSEEKEILECFYFIKHNPPRDSGTWGGAIHKGACRVNGRDCKDVDGCFIKKLYQQLQLKDKMIEKAKETLHKVQTACQYDFVCNDCHLDDKTCLCLIADKCLQALAELRGE